MDYKLNTVAVYSYNAWGEILSVTDSLGNEITDESHIANINPIRYRGYYYDTETGFYYCGSRYYNPVFCRWINADNQLSAGGDILGTNLYVYCGNDPVNRIDPTGEAWYHWVLGAAVVAACAVATVVTAGGFAAAAGAVAAVGSGIAAATTASTVAAGAFIGSATVYGIAAATAAATSSSVSEFNSKGNWGTVAATTGGAVLGGGSAYIFTRSSSSSLKDQKASSKSVGKPFDPKGPKVQIGVDPKTLTPSKNLESLDTYRLKNAEI